MIFRFGDIELDTQRIELSRDGEAHRLGPRVYAFLLYLIQHRDRVISKDELLDAVWPDTAVSEAALQQCAAQVRRVLGQRRGSEPIIAAVYGQGYRFEAPAVEIAEEPQQGASTTQTFILSRNSRSSAARAASPARLCCS